MEDALLISHPSASICWVAADSPPTDYIVALMRWAKDLKDREAKVKDGLPDVGMLSYVVVNSGGCLRYTLSDQDIEGLLRGKYEWSPSTEGHRFWYNFYWKVGPIVSEEAAEAEVTA